MECVAQEILQIHVLGVYGGIQYILNEWAIHSETYHSYLASLTHIYKFRIKFGLKIKIAWL